MMDFLKRVLKLLPIFFTALILAVIVWISSVSSSDPNEVVSYTSPVPLTVLGQNPDYLITQQSAIDLTITFQAPRSVLNQITRKFYQMFTRINPSSLTSCT